MGGLFSHRAETPSASPRLDLSIYTGATLTTAHRAVRAGGFHPATVALKPDDPLPRPVRGGRPTIFYDARDYRVRVVIPYA